MRCDEAGVMQVAGFQNGAKGQEMQARNQIFL